MFANLISVFFVVVFSSTAAQLEPLILEPNCSGTNCDIFRAIIMKVMLGLFDFDCMYTNYLLNVTDCLCDSSDGCIGSQYNMCIQQEVPDKVACRTCCFVDMHIANAQETDFNCFPQTELLEYRNCICQDSNQECPGVKHNNCFSEVFWSL